MPVVGYDYQQPNLIDLTGIQERAKAQKAAQSQQALANLMAIVQAFQQQKAKAQEQQMEREKFDWEKGYKERLLEADSIQNKNELARQQAQIVAGLAEKAIYPISSFPETPTNVNQMQDLASKQGLDLSVLSSLSPDKRMNVAQQLLQAKGVSIPQTPPDLMRTNVPGIGEFGAIPTPDVKYSNLLNKTKLDVLNKYLDPNTGSINFGSMSDEEKRFIGALPQSNIFEQLGLTSGINPQPTIENNQPKTPNNKKADKYGFYIGQKRKDKKGVEHKYLGNNQWQ